jgi:hypothetical protein
MARADALLLDIGGCVGAVVVYTEAAYAGAELELAPAGSPRSHYLHNVVRRRTDATGKTHFAAVFPEVREGRYTLWCPGSTGPLGEVAVAGGHVSKVHAGGLPPAA